MKKNKKKYANMNNDSWKRFLRVIKKIDSINIVLKYKLRGIYERETFFTKKKFYELNLDTIYDLNR